MFGNNEGYRPGEQTYRMDGMPVSQSQFMLEVNSGRIGGAFGLLFMSARMSARQFAGYSVKYNINDEWTGSNVEVERNFGNNLNAAFNVAGRVGATTVWANWLVNDSLSIVAGLIPLAQQAQTKQPSMVDGVIVTSVPDLQ